ncbi:MAG: VOC family protein, partial [Sphingomonadales bacterium]
LNLLGPGTAHADRNVLMDIEAKYPGYTHIALRVGSLDDARAFFEENGIEITGSFSFKDLSAIFVRDPDGNVIEFDEYAGDEPETRKNSPGYEAHP